MERTQGLKDFYEIWGTTSMGACPRTSFRNIELAQVVELFRLLSPKP